MPLISTRGGASARGFGFFGGPGAYEITYLAVAGGGNLSSVGYLTGGGGAGGYLTGTTALLKGTTYTVTVGSAEQDSEITGAGFITINANAGGRGNAQAGTGGPGGSGGGAGFGGTIRAGGTATPSGQGNDGGASAGSGWGGAGGGGGAGEAGNTDGPPLIGVPPTGAGSRGGFGGDGLQNSITGSSLFYAGGGGGGADADSGGTSAPGGDGGGGAGSDGSSANGTPAVANTGGGGGGSKPYGPAAGQGGSGIVILRIPTENYSATTTGSPTVTTDGSFTVVKYTGSGSYTG
jgi:hypothetical protein